MELTELELIDDPIVRGLLVICFEEQRTNNHKTFEENLKAVINFIRKRIGDPIYNIERLRLKGEITSSFHHEINYDMGTSYTLAMPGMSLDDNCVSGLRVHVLIMGNTISIDAGFIYTDREIEELKSNLEHYIELLRPYLLGNKYAV